MNQPIELRRRLVTLTTSALLGLSFDRSGAARLLADPYTTILGIPLDDAAQSIPELRELEESGTLVPGGIFVRNPFSGNRYVELSASWEQFLRAKYLAVARVCQLLGASSIEVIDSHVEATGQKGKLAASGTVMAEADASVALKRSLTDEYRLNAVFSGRAARPGEARRYIMERGLQSEPTLLNLLDLRQDSTNPLADFNLTLDLMKEARTEFEFGIKLAPTLAKLKLGGIGVSYESTTTYTSRVELRVHFTA